MHTVAYTFFSRGSVFLEDKTGSTMLALLQEAQKPKGSVERLLLVAAFAGYMHRSSSNVLLALLQAAQKPKGSIERLLLVAAFAQSAFQAVGKLKPMIPIMGETYEVRMQQLA